MWTYFIQGPPLSPVKIGRAVDVEKRLSSLQTGTPNQLRVLRILEGDRESEMHQRFAEDRIRGEWFRWSPAIEAFVAEPMEGCNAVWHMVNAYCTNEQRESFNEWKTTAWLAADELRDWVRNMAMIHGKDVPPQINELMGLLSKTPWLST